ncbi:MAG: helix-turn-helix transcriptional regulator [Clostridia bacterium]|nr:helix-turn-helix transcriptional regulator [Clostridia bacterium]
MRTFRVNIDGSEQLEYTWENMPVRISSDRLSIFQNYAAACHWHEDFEVLIATDGEMDYFVNGQTLHLQKGEGVFVNARRLHYGYSRTHRDCGFRFMVFHPRLFGTLQPIARQLEAFAADDSMNACKLGAASEAVFCFQRMYESAKAGDAMGTLAQCAELIHMLHLQMTSEGAREDADWSILRKMTGYIQNHYQERVTLEQIAASGAVCRNRCCVLFRQRLSASPMEYVARFRLEQACALLRGGANVTEAALSSGFHGASYFAEVFRSVYHMTPREYQKRVRIEEMQ